MAVVASGWSSSLAPYQHSWLWLPGFRRDDKSRLHRRPLPDAREPSRNIAVGGIERLADLVAEIDPAIEQNVGQREALAAEIFPSVRHLVVEPLHAVPIQ